MKKTKSVTLGFPIGFILICTKVFGGFEGYRFGPLIKDSCTIDSVAAEVTPLLHAFMKKTRYDRSVYFLETNLNPLSHECIQEGACSKFHSGEIIRRHGGANCVGISYILQEFLLKTLNRKFQMIVGTLPIYMRQAGLPSFSHAALLLQCQDGILLVDPSMNIPKPIPLSESYSHSTDLGFRGHWTFKINSQNERIEVQVSPQRSNPPEEGKENQEEVEEEEKKDENQLSLNPPQEWNQKRVVETRYEYFLKEILNPDEAITQRYFPRDRKVLIFPLFFPDEISYRMVLNLDKLQIEYTKTYPNGSYQYLFTIPFVQILKTPQLLAEICSEKVSQQLRVARSLLIERVRQLIERVLPQGIIGASF